MNMGLAKVIEKETSLCVKCGACRSVCPIIPITSREHGSARGKIALARHFMMGDELSGRGFKEAIAQCLLCMSCTEVCANRVRTDRIIIAVKSKIRERDGLAPELLRIIKGFTFSNPGVVVAFLKMFQGIFTRVDGEKKLQALRFSFPGFSGRYFPILRGKPFLRKVNSVSPGTRSVRYSFFVGCMLNYAYQHIAEKVYRLLMRHGAEVSVPAGQMCCGLPLLADGYLEEAREIARRNIEIFQGFYPDRVVVACASCGSMLKEYYPYILSGTEYESMATEFSRRIVDISEILVEEKNLRGGTLTPVRNITFHDPCHLRRGMGVYEQPRYVIKKAGYDLTEMNESDKCCGFSGSFSFNYPEMSSTILKRKIDNATSSGAETIITSCPGCIMQLKSGAHIFNPALKVMHLVELLD